MTRLAKAKADYDAYCVSLAPWDRALVGCMGFVLVLLAVWGLIR